MAIKKQDYYVYSAIRGNIVATVTGYKEAKARSKGLFLFYPVHKCEVERTEYGFTVMGVK